MYFSTIYLNIDELKYKILRYFCIECIFLFLESSSFQKNSMPESLRNIFKRVSVDKCMFRLIFYGRNIYIVSNT